jgi:hypothetical protein
VKAVENNVVLFALLMFPDAEKLLAGVIRWLRIWSELRTK